MSDYRPWDPKPTEAPAADDGYRPWAEPPKETATDEPAPKELSHAPGLGEAAPPKRSERRRPVAAAMTLWTGGSLLVLALAVAVGMSTIATGEETFEEDHGDAEDVRFVRDIIAWPAFLVGAGMTAAGVGHLYRRPWGRGATIAANILGIILIVPILPSIIALANLGGDP